jgi:hypothetical protein
MTLLFPGKIPYYTLPPKRDSLEDSDAVIISESGKEFKIDEIYKAESSYISGLKSIEDFHHIEIPPNAPPGIDEEMLEVISFCKCDFALSSADNFAIGISLKSPS